MAAPSPPAFVYTHLCMAAHLCTTLAKTNGLNMCMRKQVKPTQAKNGQACPTDRPKTVFLRLVSGALSFVRLWIFDSRSRQICFLLFLRMRSTPCTLLPRRFLAFGCFCRRHPSTGDPFLFRGENFGGKLTYRRFLLLLPRIRLLGVINGPAVVPGRAAARRR